MDPKTQPEVQRRPDYIKDVFSRPAPCTNAKSSWMPPSFTSPLVGQGVSDWSIQAKKNSVARCSCVSLFLCIGSAIEPFSGDRTSIPFSSLFTEVTFNQSFCEAIDVSPPRITTVGERPNAQLTADGFVAAMGSFV